MDVADISHQVGNLCLISRALLFTAGIFSYISLIISDLLVDIVVTKNLVN